MADAASAGDLERALSLTSTSAVWIDDRLLATREVETLGPREGLSRLMAGGPLDYQRSIIAVRSERLCLSRHRVSLADAQEWEYLVLVLIDDHGLLEFSRFFDVDDLVRALDELDVLWAEMEGLGFRPDLRPQYVELQRDVAREHPDVATWLGVEGRTPSAFLLRLARWASGADDAPAWEAFICG